MHAALLLLPFVAPPQDPAHALVSVERVWDRAEHQAFTDLVRLDGRLYCAFREGASHVYGRDGVVRVLASDDGLAWRPVALLEEEGTDLRDPKLSVTPEGRLMVTMGGSVYEGRTLVRRRPKVCFMEGAGFGEVVDARIDPAIATDNDWLWRVTWRGEQGFGVTYQIGDPWALQLVKTNDGVHYDHVATLDVDGRPNETTLRFRADGTLVALTRREAADQRAMVGTASPPYTEWSWKALPVRIGGPNFVVLPGGDLLVAGREYGADGARTLLARATVAGGWAPLLRLPSGGDTSYPGLLLEGERLLVSYYSGHEGKTSVYLARLRLPNLLAR